VPLFWDPREFCDVNDNHSIAHGTEDEVRRGLVREIKIATIFEVDNKENGVLDHLGEEDTKGKEDGEETVRKPHLQDRVFEVTIRGIDQTTRDHAVQGPTLNGERVGHGLVHTEFELSPTWRGFGPLVRSDTTHEGLKNDVHLGIHQMPNCVEDKGETSDVEEDIQAELLDVSATNRSEQLKHRLADGHDIEAVDPEIVHRIQADHGVGSQGDQPPSDGHANGSNDRTQDLFDAPLSSPTSGHGLEKNSVIFAEVHAEQRADHEAEDATEIL